MNDKEDPWDARAERFDYRPIRTSIAGIGAGWILTLVIIGLVLITGVLLWAFGVFTSDIRGAGDAEQIKNSASNRIAAQEQFEGRFAEIQATDRNIGMTAAAAAANPADVKLRTEQLGQQQYCSSLIGQYNADARKFTREDFRAADLPSEIDATDSRTDCKP